MSSYHDYMEDLYTCSQCLRACQADPVVNEDDSIQLRSSCCAADIILPKEPKRKAKYQDFRKKKEEK